MKKLARSIWDYPAVALIASGVSAGINTRKKLGEKRKSLQTIPNGTLNKFLKLLHKQGLLMANSGVAKRKGERFQYSVNYDVFVDEILARYLAELKLHDAKVRKAEVFINKRMKLLAARFTLLKEGRSQLQRDSKLVDRVGSQMHLFPAPHNAYQIDSVTRNLGKLDLSLSTYKSIKSDLAHLATSRVQSVQLLQSERELLRETVRGLLYFSVIFGSKKRTISELFSIVIGMIKRGKIKAISTKNFEFQEEHYGTLLIPLNQEYPNLLKMHQYYKEQSELGYLEV